MVELITERFRLKDSQQQALAKIGLVTVADLLRYFPHRYGEKLDEKSVEQSAVGDKVTLVGRVVSAKTSKGWKSKIPMGEVVIEDQSGKIKAVWFRQPYLAKKAAVGQTIRLSGKVAERKGEKYLANPDIDTGTANLEPSFSLFADENSTDSDVPLTPVYSETIGLSSLWFHHHIKKLLQDNQHQDLTDPLPTELLERYHLPALATALVWIHSPRSAADALAARKRFAFEKVFLIQLARLSAKARYQSHPAFNISASSTTLSEFKKRINFPLTNAQERAITQILTDLQSGQPMMRLLEGDVGSGKTAVAAATAQAVVKAGLEVAYMAPTEILAKQHFESFIQYFGNLGIQVGLITGTECRKFPSKIFLAGRGAQHTHISRPQLLKWVANGEIPILVGTHALIQKAVKFKNLAYAIIDEQHRFGVKQRAALVRKDTKFAPHLLSMTATPIPRTLALTVYGDLDLTLLDEMPAGRRAIITKIIAERERASAYAAAERELAAGRQAYVICPRIDEPDPTKELALNTKSAKAEQKRLQEKVFPHHTVGLLHSKMTPIAKEEVMKDFTDGKIDILVATSVVEVGVNVPNATVIIIEGAERFGLAQLHQLRGRVLRSNHQAYCYLFTTSGKTESTRLQALEKAKNGFELAELDLKLRGAGALGSGPAGGGASKQWGLSDLGMEALQNLKMVEAARTEAQKILNTDPELKKYPLLREQIHQPQTEVHFE